jgi:hypothetical protein
VIQGMGSFGMVNENDAIQIQNFLICIEMLIARLELGSGLGLGLELGLGLGFGFL